MIKFKLFFKKSKITLIVLLIFALLLILGTNYIIKEVRELAKVPSTRIHLINIAKVAIPLKNLILMRNLDDKIALLESSGSCVFCDLNQGNFKENDLEGVDLRYASLIGADLSNANLSGANFSNDTARSLGQMNTSLQEANLSGANLNRVNLSNMDLTGTILTYAKLSGAILDGVDLSNKDLTGTNLSGVDLSNMDLTGTILLHANLSGAILDGVDLSNKDLTGTNLSGVDLSNMDLTGTILEDTSKIEISLKNPSNSNWPALNEIQNLNVTRYDLSGDVQYLATREGFLFESKNNESRLVLDLNDDAQFPFSMREEGGLLGIASQNNLVYISYSSQNDDQTINAPLGTLSLVVDEYSKDFSKVRNILKIDGFTGDHLAGGLVFDQSGQLYLSVGDAQEVITGEINAQDLNSLKGKILRLDVSESNLGPEIIAYGIRNPWGITIDSNDRMFISQCGADTVESVYLLDELNPKFPVNFGWPVFEGSKRIRNDPLILKDVLAPIFETDNRPGCLTGGVYLNDIESFLFADFYGTIRLLKQKENGDWYLIHEYKQEKFIWGLGFDKKTKKIFVAPNNLELEILVDQVKLN